MRLPLRSLFASVFLCLSSAARAGARDEVQVRKNIEYAKVGDVSLALDLYVPRGEVRPPLIAWVHGGAWRAGSKADMPLMELVKQGYAVASIDYRLSTVALFPAQAHDLKAAIRFLRAKVGEYGLDGRNIAIAGGSAGGHLAALVGTSNGVPDLEGTEGGFLKTSSDVQAIVSFYGASNLQSILSQSTPHGLSVREPALRLLLGGLPDEKPELARLASPVVHVRPGAPPLLLVHGDADPQMPFEQSRELKEGYEKAKRPVILEVITGGRHGGPQFYDEQRLTLVTKFLADALRHPQQPPPSKPDVSYGPSRHQLLDVYLPAASAQPAPVLLWFGGIWQPSKGAPALERLLRAGVAVVAVETRTMNDAVRSGEGTPIALVMNDAVRAVQFVRQQAAEWRLDSKRIAAGGSSQGALPALYLGCAGELAQPDSADLLERFSTQVIAVGAHRSQPTIDPARMDAWVPGVQWGAPAFGVAFGESYQRRAQFVPAIQKYSPDALLHRGAAPIYFENNWGLTQPDGVTRADYEVHSPAWAIGFQELATKADVKCYVQYPGHPVEGYADVFDFLTKTLTARER